MKAIREFCSEAPDNMLGGANRFMEIPTSPASSTHRRLSQPNQSCQPWRNTQRTGDAPWLQPGRLRIAALGVLLWRR